MKLKYKKGLAIPFVALVLGTACTANFEDINTPREAVSGDILARDSYDLNSFITQLLNNAFPEQENAYQMNYDLIGNYLGRYLTYTSDGWNGKTHANFNAPDSWIRYPFRDMTPKIIANMNRIKELAERDGDPSLNLNYNWGLILRAHAFLHLTDKYGPLPLGLDKEKPSAYNSQEFIYKTIIKDLDDAAQFIKKNSLGVVPEATKADKVYGGDFRKWRKFANSLRLRMALRMRSVEPELAQQLAEQAVADGVIEQNEDNFNRRYNPLGLYKTTEDWGDSRACADIITHLTGFKDPRLPKYFKPVEKKEDPDHPDYLGLYAGASTVSKSAAVKAYSSVNITATGVNPWLTAAEMYFCRAEGALFGWNMGGATAQAYYEQGVQTSFDQWGVGSAKTYLADTESFPADYVDYARKAKSVADQSGANFTTIAWDDEEDLDSRLQRIITQKWIALFPNGQEAWSDMRRTGFPMPLEIKDRNGSSLQVPNRIPFDSEERVNNPANYAEALVLLGGADDYNTPMWWAKK